jgi:hypothetical protein
MRATVSCLILALASAARADVTPPGAARGPQPGFVTRWPAVLPCERPVAISASGEPEAEVDWSNARGQKMRVKTDWRIRPFPAALARARLTALRGPGSIVLTVTCEDHLQEIQWWCDQYDSVCDRHVRYGFASAAERAAYLAHVEHIERVRRDPAGGRALMIADALALLDDACAGGRCRSDDLEAARQLLRARAAAPSWVVRQQTAFEVEMGPERTREEGLGCSRDMCVLSLPGLTFSLERPSEEPKYVEWEAVQLDGWRIDVSSLGVELQRDVIR